MIQYRLSLVGELNAAKGGSTNMPAVHLQENTKLISGHVAEKKGYLYWVLNITENGKGNPSGFRHIGKLGK